RLRRCAPRTTLAGPECWRERCSAARPGCPCASPRARTARWRSPSPSRSRSQSEQRNHLRFRSAFFTRVSHINKVFLHVPGTGRAALCAQAAVQAHVLVLHHDAPGFEIVGDVEILRRVARRCLEALAEIRFLTIPGECDAIHRIDVNAGIALDAERGREN